MAEEAKIKKPLPQLTPLNRPFWEGARAGKLVMQRCTNCRAWVWCPRPVCGECGSDKLEWTELSGRGKVFSFTVIREVVGRALRGFAPDIPYVTAWIDLHEGPRFCSNIVGCPIGQIKIGMDVEVIFEDTGEGVTLPKFRPRATE
ncbi:MAG TPA: Zn-ribbon domain-containing OB-fold protein [Candidatus Eisenbacteria bacterium]|nr:Zn-ribbon domain-containing OB-fold protein [Candidatus Eisenbacteria bacterium]